jgi:hypothetical protein
VDTKSFIITIVLILCPFLLEVICLLKGRDLFHITIINHCRNSVKSLSKEIKDDDLGKVLCGYAVSLSIFAFILCISIFAIVNIFEHNWTRFYLTIILFILLPVPLLLSLHSVNQFFIAFLRKRSN